MKKRFADMIKIGVLVPAIVVSMAACGAANAQGTGSNEAAAAETKETKAEGTDQAAEAKVYTNGDYKLTVPAELADKITVDTPTESEDGIVFDCYETKSVEAAKGTDHENMSQGWLFGITVRTEEKAHEILANDDAGQEPIARTEDGTYFIYNHPTDVRYERATPEEMAKDQAEWDAACEWAASVRKSFAEENGLTAIIYNGTQVEAALAKIAYGKDVNYTINSLESGVLSPGDVDPLPFYEKLTNGATYEEVSLADNEKPDGEYIVLEFPDDNIRYDFFLMEGKENIIRQVNTVEGGEQYESYYTVTFADGTSKASEIMNEWYHALAQKQ